MFFRVCLEREGKKRAAQFERLIKCLDTNVPVLPRHIDGGVNHSMTQQNLER